MVTDHEDDDRQPRESPSFRPGSERYDNAERFDPKTRKAPKRVTFDDFQITRSVQQQQVDEEKRAWQERQDRLEQQKPALLKFAAPRLRSLKDEMIGQNGKFSFFRRKGSSDTDESMDDHENSNPSVTKAPYFADHERNVVRVSRKDDFQEEQEVDPDEDRALISRYYDEAGGDFDKQLAEENDYSADAAPYESDTEELESQLEELSDPEYSEVEEEYLVEEYIVEEIEEGAAVSGDFAESGDRKDRGVPGFVIDELPVDLGSNTSGVEAATTAAATGPAMIATGMGSVAPSAAQRYGSLEDSLITEEPMVDASLKAFLDSLRAFDSRPRRAHEPRDPRADFVTLLGELLDILREQTEATAAMFFWVNTRKQQLVLESAALDDRAYQFLASDKRFPIELDAVSRVVTKRKPELHSAIPAQAELDLIPYYREAIGIASFAGMPVLFGDGLVGVLTIDSVVEDSFSQETLRILTTYSKLLSGLIRSYIEKYDLLASARTLESARKLHQIVSPESSLRVSREQRKNPEYILRALSEAASEIIDWDWLATAAFDDNRRLWSIASLQSKHSTGYVPPQTPISLQESIVGKCLQTGRSSRHDVLTPTSIRFNTEEDRLAASGHSFLTIPIRTTNKNYGALAIEHSERGRFTDADVETLEHLARSAAAALEIIALSEIVGERALTDLLTASLNKRGLLQRLNEELSRAMEFDEPLTLVLFEIDGASEFFARFAQEDSDTIVLALTRLLRFGSRPFDVIARVGEHSFAAVLIKMTDEDAYLWSEKMRKMIVSEVIAIGKRSFSVTVSVGVSGARRDGTVDELIEGAELAIERAKELGGNNVIVY